jgi:hypothetical protein
VRVFAACVLALALAGCGSSEPRPQPAADRALDFALGAQRLAEERSELQSAADSRAATAHETGERSATLRADAADLELSVREDLPLETPAHASILDALEAVRFGRVDAAHAHLRDAAFALDDLVPAERRSDIARLERPLP